MSVLRDLAVRFKLRACVRVGDGVLVRGKVWIRGHGKVTIGQRVVLDGSHVPIELNALAPESEIVIGDDVRIDGGTSIEAQRSVTIGARSRLGSFCKIMDTHFHDVTGDRYERPPSVAVIVEQDVDLGAKTILLPGAHIEHDARIRPGTVVTRRVRAHAVVAGVPAQAILPPSGSGGSR